MRKAEAAGVSFSVAPAPARADEIPLPEEPREAGAGSPPRPRGGPAALRWTVPLLLGLALAGWALRPLFGLVRRIAARLAESRRRRLDSEPAWFARVRRAASRGDAAAAYKALLAWAARRRPEAPLALEALVAEGGDAALETEVLRRGRTVYGRVRPAGAWSGRELLRALRAFRRKHGRDAAAAEAALGPLNPGGSADSFEPARSLGRPGPASPAEPGPAR
jgi:hypothetical protein